MSVVTFYKEDPPEGGRILVKHACAFSCACSYDEFHKEDYL